MLILMLFQGSLPLFAQQIVELVDGKISYITGQNVYVKFTNTEGIENGDTLFVSQNVNLIPVLIVQHHSSISCLCSPIGENRLKVSDSIVAKIKLGREKKETVVPVPIPEETVEQDVNEQVLTSTGKGRTAQLEKSKNVNGRFSLSSYSNFSNTVADDIHRLRYTFTIQAENISESKVSAETYISFTHKLNQWDVVQENLNNALKIYSLALRYDFNSSASVWAGRKINPRIANAGAVDGLQFQKEWGDFYTGVVAGTRPDYQDYGFNPDLLEYGAYIGHNSNTQNGFAQTSVAFFEQRNSGAIDRRFVYFQHSNSIVENLNFFSSFELDLYKLENGEPKNAVSLTSLYLSLRYRLSKRFSMFGSYDNRKNVIYYETFKSYVDEIIQQASRQGFRVRLNYRPVNYLNLGVNAGTRFRKEDPRPTKTFHGFATYSRIPVVEAAFTLSANLVQTSYLDGQIYGARLSKDFLSGKLSTTLNYRRVHYEYVSYSNNLDQNIGEIDFSYYFNKKLYLSVNFESTFQGEENYNRIYFNLRRKF